MKNCYIYAKTATCVLRSDRHHLSILNQVTECKAFAKLKGYNVIKTFTDIGLSGNILNRKCFNELLLNCDTNPVDTIIITDLHRLARKYDLIVKAIEMLNKKGIQVLTVNECSMKTQLLLLKLISMKGVVL